MTANSNEQYEGSPRWGYLLLAALIFLLTAAILAGLGRLPHLFPQLVAPTDAPYLPPTAASTSFQPTIPSALTPTNLPSLAIATPAPVITHPTITRLSAEVNDQAGTITFHLTADVPPDRQVDEVLLWYDTEIGHRVQHIAGPLPPSITLSHQLNMAQEGLITTLKADKPGNSTLDYWWLVRDTSGKSVRAGGTASLGPALQALITTPTPEPPPIDFTWAVSESSHFQFYFPSATAADRDLAQLAALAEAAITRTSTILEAELDGQMRIYLVPRLFWQGGVTYGDKVQLISYLDRNYTAVETWSYFTHEGTHALAQDLLQPKKEGGAPDGVLVEGLAVWASGGHYRQEPLDAWAAVVASSDDYIPLADLRSGPFYDFQHETSYLEAASFVKFLIERSGLEKLKELYGLATNDAAHDGALVVRLYGQSYADLEAAWLDYLAGLQPTPEQVETWRLTRRSFDLMRRYETELDPDARILPSTPPEWTTDTLEIFLHRLDAPSNIILETALIAAQKKLRSGDLTGTAKLLDDVEAALDNGMTGERLYQPSLQARQAIVNLVAVQDRTILRADASAYLNTLQPASGLAAGKALAETLYPPFTTYHQEVVRLDVSDDGLSAQGVILGHSQVAGGAFADDGQLFAVAFSRVGGRWLMSSKEQYTPVQRWEIGQLPQSPGTAGSGD